MKKFLNSKYGEAIVLAAATALNLLFTIIFYSAGLSSAHIVGNTSTSLWTAELIDTYSYRIVGLNKYFIAAFFVGLAISAAAIALIFVKRKKVLCYASSVYGLLLDVTFLFTGIILRLHTAATVIFSVAGILISAAMVSFLILRKRSAETEKEEQETTERAVSSQTTKFCKIAMLICSAVATALMFCTLFIPLYSQSTAAGYITFSLAKTMSSATYPVYMYVAFIVMFVACFAELFGFVNVVSFYKNDETYASKSRAYMQSATIFTVVFFVLGYTFTFISNLSGKGNFSKTVSYIPLIIMVALLIAFSVFYGKSGINDNGAGKIRNETKLKLEPLLYVAILTVITFSVLFFNVITINFDVSSISISGTSLSGAQLLTSYATLEAGFQVMSFMLFAILIASGLMLTLASVSFLAKSKDYYKVVKTSAIANLVFATLLGLFGLYFKIAQKINEENIASLLDYFNLNNYIQYSYTVESDTIFLLIASVLVIVVMIVRKQFNLTVEEPLKVEFPEGLPELPDSSEHVAAASGADTTEFDAPTTATNVIFDACPAFTELDGKEAQLVAETEEKRQNLFENPTLPHLVRFVVDYARECRLHLSYSLEDIATFVAGLGASRLAILQGMSGTGKTSLPKIFAEAILGNCEIVEVESSWRDKNELLGYYNEFSKCYTPKKFTQCLYKAKLNPETLTFIVLDEMNLSRIEYYFSDFLSLMENEEDKREIKLLNVKLKRAENGEQIQYRGLTDGHTLKIPANVWFVGTANRDESTFAISDKVYDRAQTMNFDKRAPKIHSFSEPIAQRFVPYETLRQLFDDAKAAAEFDAEECLAVKQTEKLLAPYNISFGNRILKQMEDFVKIYCACFGDKDAVQKDAVERILLSKVVSKLENKAVENKETLAAEFDKIGLPACGAFVRKLNED